MSSRRAFFAVCAAVLLAAAPLTASAGPLMLAKQTRSEPLSLGQAAELVRKRVGGRVLAADVVRSERGTYYQIRVLVKKGQVKVYRVDPDTGRMF